ncbi:MAG: nitrate reductase molybdenum cofactor assembly chaperone [Gammaproteobacteria bacterium]|jgi:nitrate reductase molybdenum cofactor assembly chaperone NarJ/NarW|nr:nitrate reductase molybdenum cofactor assembly chaperone [Gammaproteobacteria bacterium]MBT4146863.1 nitrate reductase molybdenum cofactor assembly chaperone [Gammaproteobacteria bacterium]MBT5826150.1 nitrate reductase molybdenum cofactor assembly chaperone [Gammaproteobacteria bacterium]MBT5965699.1 nitrate reductase molybdenum cofactor assembly chaperone [Gammaproteobacteria bacterium]MBT6419703.1 nitrate reductase molybdenum cofactor assembly chaperone [Gammaproteobacteria bacterium]
MTQIYKVLSILLEYPTKDLVAHWDDINQLIAGLPDLESEDKKMLSGFTHWASRLSLTKFQAEYVNNFDMTAENSLYLTYHLFDEQDRDRGPALIELAELYKSTGFEIDGGELPDYLPLILEYVSTMDDIASAQEFLQQTSQAAGIIASNLDKNESPYAPLVKMVERHGHVADIAA